MKSKEKKTPTSNIKNNNITMKMVTRATTQNNIQILNHVKMGKVRMKMRLTMMIINYSSSNKKEVKNQTNKMKYIIQLHRRPQYQRKLRVLNQRLSLINKIIIIIITSAQSIIEVTFRIR